VRVGKGSSGQPRRDRGKGSSGQGELGATTARSGQGELGATTARSGQPRGDCPYLHCTHLNKYQFRKVGTRQCRVPTGWGWDLNIGGDQRYR